MSNIFEDLVQGFQTQAESMQQLLRWEDPSRNSSPKDVMLTAERLHILEETRIRELESLDIFVGRGPGESNATQSLISSTGNMRGVSAEYPEVHHQGDVFSRSPSDASNQIKKDRNRSVQVFRTELGTGNSLGGMRRSKSMSSASLRRKSEAFEVESPAAAGKPLQKTFSNSSIRWSTAASPEERGKSMILPLSRMSKSVSMGVSSMRAALDVSHGDSPIQNAPQGILKHGSRRNIFINPQGGVEADEGMGWQAWEQYSIVKSKLQLALEAASNTRQRLESAHSSMLYSDAKTSQEKYLNYAAAEFNSVVGKAKGLKTIEQLSAELRAARDEEDDLYLRLTWHEKSKPKMPEQQE